MKNKPLVGNISHFNNKIDISGLTKYQSIKLQLDLFVKIASHQINVGDGCYWIKSWKAFASTDNKTFIEVDSISRTAALGDKVFTLDTPVVANYFRIDGSLTGCDTPYRFVFNYVKFFW